jgi:ADP-ribosylglycohydrolase
LTEPIDRARIALEGLSVGDAFGEQLLHAGPHARSVGGDIDTTCAIVGGIVVGAVGLAGIPADWRASREPLPAM